MTKLKKNQSNSIQDNNSPWEFWAPILMTIALYSGIRHFVAEARYIPSGSMLPSLQIQDRILIEKLTLSRRPPKRGEIVVFRSPFSFDPVLSNNNNSPSFLQCTIVNFPLVSFLTRLRHPACDAYIKRVVAVSGDKVVVNSLGEVLINNSKTYEPYVSKLCIMPNSNIGACKELRVEVPSHHVLVLGDNRQNSWDGRFWPGGAFLPEKEIIGRAVWRFWPFNRVGLLHQ